MLLPGCTALTAEDWADARNGAEPGVVVDYNLENYVAIPVTGQAPITSLTREGVNVAVEWKDGAGNPLAAKSFTTGEVYRAVIVLKAKTGYVFDPDIDFDYQSNLVTVKTLNPPAGSVNRAVEDAETISAYFRTVEAEYPPAKPPEENSNVVIDYNLQDYVPVPVTDWAPVKNIVNRKGVTGSVVWKNSSGEVINNLSKFVGGEVYKADITLNTTGSYVFDEKIPFKYPDGSVAVQPEDELGKTARVLSVTYKPASAATKITVYDLTSYIPAPVGGNQPVRYVDVVKDGEPEYSGLVLWSPAHVVFQEGVTYTASVFLYAGPLRRFENDNFKHDEGSCLNHPWSASYRTLNIGFPPAAKGQNSGGNDDNSTDIDMYLPL